MGVPDLRIAIVGSAHFGSEAVIEECGIFEVRAAPAQGSTGDRTE